jgi:hypothetical protein
MADLAAVIASLGGQGAALARGTVTAVGGGAVTVALNGGSYTNVAYLGTAPAVNAQVALLIQEGWGMIALGVLSTVPAPAALPALGTVAVDPSTMANWVATPAGPGAWQTSLGDQVQSAEQRSSGVWFYAAGAFAAVPAYVERLDMALEMTEGTVVELALHGSAGPVDTLVTLPGTPSRAYRLDPGDAPVTVTLPIGWAALLKNGTARGVMARSQIHDARLFGHGTLTFTGV